jgi:hypothetical protein
VTTFRTAGLRTKGNLRVKRRDPLRRANAPPQAAADPALRGQDADDESQACLGPVRGRVAQPPAQASSKASLEIQRRETLDGPATRPMTPLAAENGVGKPAAPARVRA